MNGRAEGTMLFIGLYAFFLFGLVFDDPLIAEVHPVPAYLTVLLFGGLLVLCAFRAAPTPSAPGTALLMLILIGLTAADSLHVRDEITEIAPEFAHARFSVLFIPFALSASLAVTRKHFSSFVGVSTLFLPPILAGAFGMYLAFIGSGPIGNVSFGRLIDLKPSFFGDALLLFGDLYPLVLLMRSEKKQIGKRPVILAFSAVMATLAAELIKYRLFFGEGVPALSRPDRAMLAMIPWVNVQELFILFYTTAYLLKTGVYLDCALLCLPAVLPTIKSALSVILLLGGVYLAFGFFVWQAFDAALMRLIFSGLLALYTAVSASISRFRQKAAKEA